MIRLNNKGFAISTILFSILILGTLVFGTLYATTASNSSCYDGCCNPPCSFPEKEEVNNCPSFKDFDCPGEFKIGSESFCVLRTYSSSNTSINDDVVVALAKYYVNPREDKNDISTYGLQYKYAFCNDMYAEYIKNNYSSKFQENHMSGYYSTIKSTDSKYKTMIKNPVKYKPYSTGITYESCNENRELKNYDLEYVNKNNIFNEEDNTIPTLIDDYYTNLNEIIRNDSRLNQINGRKLVVRLLNLRDMSIDDNELINRHNRITDNNINSLINDPDHGWYYVTNILGENGGLDENYQFPCYTTRVRTTARNYSKRCLATYVKDDIFGDNGGFGGYDCPYYYSYEDSHSSLTKEQINKWLNKNYWIYFPSAHYDCTGTTEYHYYTDIVSIEPNNYNFHIISINSALGISRSTDSLRSEDSYWHYYFRPVIEINKSFYDQLDKKANPQNMNITCES